MHVVRFGIEWQYEMQGIGPHGMQRDRAAIRFAGIASMAVNGGAEGKDFVDRLSDVFARELFQPMFQRAPVAAGDVRQLIAEFRRKLDALDEVIATASPQVPGGRSPFAALAGGEADGEDGDDIGRNQRSRLRELHLLEAMARESRPYSLQQLLAALAQRGFSDDTSGAVVSQLHRLKKVGAIQQPASGMYQITGGGLGHLHKLRTSFGALAGDAR
jgi:hypothetical protein